MSAPQSGIFALGTRAHHHLQFDLTGEGDVAAAVGAVRREATSVGGVNLVLGFGPWLVGTGRLVDAEVELVDPGPIVGEGGFTIPDAQHDLWVWLHGSGPDGVLDAARAATEALRGVATLVDEQQSFGYGASHDLTGFEDGTENPDIDQAVEVAVVAPGRAGAGGSVVLVQRWLHDLASFEALEVPDQELAIGRSKADSIELDESVQLPTAHVSRVVIEDDDGSELQVFRRSTPFGGVQDHGLLFVAFSADQARLRRMLERMAGVGDGVRDRLTEFSEPRTSAWYFAPPIDLLPG